MNEREQTLRFLSALGHELRNPLAALTSGFNLLERSQSPEKTASLVSMMRDKLRTIGELVDECFDVAKLSLTFDRGVSSDVRIGEILSRAVERVAPRLEKTLGKIPWEKVPSGESLAHVSVNTNPELLTKLLMESLLFVALSPAAGKVSEPSPTQDRTMTIEAHCEGNSCFVAILPTTPLSLEGYEMVHAERGTTAVRPKDSLVVTESLQALRADLLRTLAELLELTLEISPVGVKVTVPAVTQSRPASEPDSKNASLGIGRARKVLVVEDSEDSASLLCSLLLEGGYEVESAPDGATAIKLTSEWRPAVILLDVGLPDMDGLEVARRIRREISRDYRPVIIAVTGYGEADTAGDLMAAGLDHYLTKPIDFEQLDKVLKSFFPQATEQRTDSLRQNRPGEAYRM